MIDDEICLLQRCSKILVRLPSDVLSVLSVEGPVLRDGVRPLFNIHGFSCEDLSLLHAHVPVSNVQSRFAEREIS